MFPNLYYLDSCIWLNLFKKEIGSLENLPYWKITKIFLENSKTNNSKIIISTIILKELYFVSGNKFNYIKKFFKINNIIIEKTTNEDYYLARQFENENKKLSFYDYLHVAIAKRLNAVLITRDKDLILFAKNYINVFKPEELI